MRDLSSRFIWLYIDSNFGQKPSEIYILASFGRFEPNLVAVIDMYDTLMYSLSII